MATTTRRRRRLLIQHVFSSDLLLLVLVVLLFSFTVLVVEALLVQRRGGTARNRKRLFVGRNQNQNNKNGMEDAVSHESSSVDEKEEGDSKLLFYSERRRFIRDIVLLSSTSAVFPVNALAASSSSSSSSSSSFLIPSPSPLSSSEMTMTSWPLGKVAFSLLPLTGTFTRRATVEQEIVPDTIWTHDQLLGIVNVNVPVRQTVVRLQDNQGLWVHNPVAPTPQLLQMMQRLTQKYNCSVRHIVLGTVALEHKATFCDFCSHFPNATVWLQPGQWAFPLNIPIEFYGLVQRGPRLREIPILLRNESTSNTEQAVVASSSQKYRYYAAQHPIPEWAVQDFDYEVLGPFQFQSVGAFSETAFYHKPTKTLIVTDTVTSVTATPPPILQEDPRALLYHARDNIGDTTIVDSPAVRAKGWRRMVQFGLVFFPSQITITPTLTQALQDTIQVPPSLRNLGDGAIPFGGLIYPWAWNDNDADIANFNAISQNGRLFCPPILTKLILDREPQATLAWVDRVSTRFKDMQRIIPCHLNNNVMLNKRDGSDEFYHAFDPLRSRPGNVVPERPLAEDLALLQKASDVLTSYGIVAPSQVCDGEAARQRGRFAASNKQ